MADKLPVRWTFKHGAFYYRPKPAERHLFDGKSWYRLGRTYPEALRAMADIRELELGETVADLVDGYTAEVLPTLKPQTRNGYGVALKRIRGTLGHNRAAALKPKIVYQYRNAVKQARGMNPANTDLKVLNGILDYGVEKGILDRNNIKGAVSYYGKRAGLRKERERYVEDWELTEWRKVAKPQHVAFAALVMLIGTRKADTLRITEQDITDDALYVYNSKTGKTLAFSLTPALRAAIQEAHATKPKPSPYLFPNSLGSCYVGEDGRCQSFDRAWREGMVKAIRETDLEESFTRHDLRAKVGSDADTDERAMELLGHSSMKTTRAHYRRKKQPIRPVK